MPNPTSAAAEPTEAAPPKPATRIQNIKPPIDIAIEAPQIHRAEESILSTRRLKEGVKNIKWEICRWCA